MSIVRHILVGFHLFINVHAETVLVEVHRSYRTNETKALFIFRPRYIGRTRLPTVCLSHN